MALRTCDNCERTIGNLELDFTWQGRRVCAECYRRLSAALPVGGGLPQVAQAAQRQPAKPWTFWLGIGLFALAAALITLEIVREVQPVLDQLKGGGDPTQAMHGLGLGGSGDSTAGAVGLLVAIVNLIGFIMAWRGYLVGAVIALATAVALVAMEGMGYSVIGLKLTAMYVAGLAVMVAGFFCFLLPPSLEYYRRCAAWRRGGG